MYTYNQETRHSQDAQPKRLSAHNAKVIPFSATELVVVENGSLKALDVESITQPEDGWKIAGKRLPEYSRLIGADKSGLLQITSG